MTTFAPWWPPWAYSKAAYEGKRIYADCACGKTFADRDWVLEPALLSFDVPTLRCRHCGHQRDLL